MLERNSKDDCWGLIFEIASWLTRRNENVINGRDLSDDGHDIVLYMDQEHLNAFEEVKHQFHQKLKHFLSLRYDIYC